jgi:hypothetical protein
MCPTVVAAKCWLCRLLLKRSSNDDSEPTTMMRHFLPHEATLVLWLHVPFPTQLSTSSSSACDVGRDGALTNFFVGSRRLLHCALFFSSLVMLCARFLIFFDISYTLQETTRGMTGGTTRGTTGGTARGKGDEQREREGVDSRTHSHTPTRRTPDPFPSCAALPLPPCPALPPSSPACAHANCE